MSELIVVNISDYKISDARMLATYALGSCVGTAVFDSVTGIGGLSHIMLPDSGINPPSRELSRMKYADTAICDMVNELISKGAKRINLRAKIAGGANMFNGPEQSPFGNIGSRNTISVKKTLKELGIPIIGEDTGGNYGRTVFLEPDTGKFTIKSIGRDVVEL